MARPRSFLSSEFVLSASAGAVGVAVAIVGLSTGRDLVLAVGAGLLAIVSVGYAHSRGLDKGRPFLPPGGRL